MALMLYIIDGAEVVDREDLLTEEGLAPFLANSYLEASSLSILDFVGQRSTCSFTLQVRSDLIDPYRPLDGAEVIVVDTDATPGDDRVFGGFIDDIEEDGDPAFDGDGSEELLTLACSCVDYTEFVDRHLVVGQWEAEVSGAVVTDLVTDYLADDGVTVDAALIEDGPVVSRIAAQYVTVGQVLDDMATRTGMSWFIDYYRRMRWFAAGSVDAPFEVRFPDRWPDTIEQMDPVAWWRLGETSGTAADSTAVDEAQRGVMATLNPVAWWRLGESSGLALDATAVDDAQAALMANLDPVAWWRLGEASGDAMDSVAGRSGTVNGNPVRATSGALPGDSDGAIDLDGTGDDVSVAHDSGLNPETSFTVAAWFRRDVDTGVAEYIVGNRDAAGTRGFDMRIVGDRLDLALGDGAAASVAAFSATVPEVGRWYLGVATYDGTTGRVYLDGVLSGSGADAYAPNLTATLRIGSRLGTSNFNGAVDEVAVWDRVLTADEIAELYDAQADSGLHGTVNGNPTRAVAGALPGDADGAIDLDGTGDYVTVPYVPATNTPTFTVAAWIRRDVDTGANEFIYDSRISSFVGFLLYIGGGDALHVSIGDGSALVEATSSAIPVGVWKLVVGTYDGTNARAYVDGVLASTSAAVTLSRNPSAAASIGSRNPSIGAANYFNGVLDEVAVWDRVLTADEILTLYEAHTNSGHPGTFNGNPTRGVDGLIANDDDGAFLLDPSDADDYVNIAYSKALNPPQYTVEAVIRMDDDGGSALNKTIFDCRSSANFGFVFYVGGTDDILRVTQGTGASAGSVSATGAGALIAGDEHHVAATYDGTTIRIYVDGVLAGSGAVAYAQNAGGVDQRIGITFAGGSPWVGVIDEVAVWDGPLSDDEIAELAAAAFATSTDNVHRIRRKRSRTNYRNVQYLKGGTETTDLRTESFKGDGAAKTFVVAYPVKTAPTITVDAVAKTVGVKGIETGFDWYWSEASGEIVQDDGAAALSSAQTIAVTYRGTYPVTVAAQLDDEITARAEREGSSGVYEMVESFPEIDRTDMAAERAEGMLRRFGTVRDQGTIHTTSIREPEAANLRAGQVQTVNVPRRGIVGDMLIDRVQVKSGPGGVTVYEYDVVSEESQGTWVDFFRRLAERANAQEQNESDTFVYVRRASEVVRVSDTLDTPAGVAYAAAIVGTAIVGMSEVGA